MQFKIILQGNLNPFDGSKQPLTNNFINQIKGGITFSTTYDITLNIIKNTIYTNPLYGKNFMKTLSFDLTSMLISCWFGGSKCNTTDFDSYVTYDKGNCYIYNFNSNGKSLKTSSQTGKAYGLQLELFNGFDGIKHIFKDF